MGEVLGPLFLVFVDSVVDRKNILGVQALLDALVHVVVQFAKSLIHESFSQFSNAVVVRDAASVLEDGLSRLVLDVFVDVHDFVFWVLVVPNRKVNINRCTSFIKLRDPETDKHVFPILTVRFTRFENGLFDIFA